MVLLLVTTRVIRWMGGWIGVAPVLDFLGSWLRLPAALALLVHLNLLALVLLLGAQVSAEIARPP